MGCYNQHHNHSNFSQQYMLRPGYPSCLQNLAKLMEMAMAPASMVEAAMGLENAQNLNANSLPSVARQLYTEIPPKSHGHRRGFFLQSVLSLVAKVVQVVIALASLVEAVMGLERARNPNAN
jgi:hypothetical protein